MIVDFTIENFGPFRDETVLSMQATGMKGLPGNISESKFTKNGLLTSAIVFGANASGKSYLAKAFSALRYMVADTRHDETQFPWYQPFRMSERCLTSPVRIRIRFVEKGVLYDYAISYSADRIVYEHLYHYPKNRRACVFLRTGPLTFDQAKKSIAGLTNGSSAYLAAASKLNDTVCSIVSKYILERVICLGSNLLPLVARSCVYLSESQDRKDMAMSGLKYADFGITDFQWTEESIDSSELERLMPLEMYRNISDAERQTVKRMDIRLKHSFRGSDDDGHEETLPLEIESSGTQNMFGLLGPLTDVLSNGGVLVIDEFGSTFHPMLSRWIVSQFSDQTGDIRAQLIANSHDMELMNTEEVLRRDQIWFTDKDRATGAAELYALSDFDGIRKNADIAKAYLNGRYDAIPHILSGKMKP